MQSHRELHIVAENLLRDIVVGNSSGLQRPDGHDIALCPCNELLCFLAVREQLVRLLVIRDNSRLMNRDALALCPHDNIRRAEIDCDICKCHYAFSSLIRFALSRNCFTYFPV